jgi:putative Mg2+ transporter-C (MgtC) family protein
VFSAKKTRCNFPPLVLGVSHASASESRLNDMNLPLASTEIVLRILAATIAGTLIGLERESHGRPAGLRTTMLTCVAAAIAMVVSECLFIETASSTAGGNWRPDPARLGAGILTGIGFLGAGTILRQNNLVTGVTTAATLWFVTVLGLAFGSGLYWLGALGVAIGMITLVGFPTLEKHIPVDWYSRLTVTMELDALNEEQLRARLKALGLKVKRMELNYDLVAKQKTISCDLKLRKKAAREVCAKAVADLRQCPGVLQITWA